MGLKHLPDHPETFGAVFFVHDDLLFGRQLAADQTAAAPGCRAGIAAVTRHYRIGRCRGRVSLVYDPYRFDRIVVGQLCKRKRSTNHALFI